MSTDKFLRPRKVRRMNFRHCQVDQKIVGTRSRDVDNNIIGIGLIRVAHQISGAICVSRSCVSKFITLLHNSELVRLLSLQIVSEVLVERNRMHAAHTLPPSTWSAFALFKGPTDSSNVVCLCPRSTALVGELVTTNALPVQGRGFNHRSPPICLVQRIMISSGDKLKNSPSTRMTAAGVHHESGNSR